MLRALRLGLLGLTLLLLGCELLLRLLPVSSSTLTGYYQDPLIISYPPGHRWTTATGWDLRNPQRHRANNAGFLAARDFAPDPEAVALIGDSFIEASMLDPGDRPGVQLEHALGGRPVFAMGGPGSALLDYAERMRWAAQRYGVRDFVLLLETGDLRQSLCGSGNVHGPCLDPGSFQPRIETVPGLGDQAGPLKRLARESALAQYLFGQLKLNPTMLWRQARLQARPPSETPASAPTADARAPSAAARVVGRRFLEQLAVLAPRRLVIVLDTQRARLYAGLPDAEPDLQAFAAMAREAGVQVVDGAPLLRRHYATHGLKFDVGPYDGHLNALGVRLLMDAAAEALRGSSEPAGNTAR